MTVLSGWAPYCGSAPIPAELMARWNFDPLLIAALLVAGWGYSRIARDLPRHRHTQFAAAMALILLLFVSPFCALSSALFSARVIHHVLLAVVVAPLLIGALPPARTRLPGSLAAWTIGQAFAFWIWHAPPAYGWALASFPAYWAMQATILLSALGFWAAVRRADPPHAAAALLATMVQMGLLGALITFSAAPLYTPHLLTTAAWGYAPLEDQQLAGLIMWAPAAGFYLAAALLLIHRWLGREAQAGAAR